MNCSKCGQPAAYTVVEADDSEAGLACPACAPLFVRRFYSLQDTARASMVLIPYPLTS